MRHRNGCPAFIVLLSSGAGIRLGRCQLTLTRILRFRLSFTDKTEVLSDLRLVGQE